MDRATSRIASGSARAAASRLAVARLGAIALVAAATGACSGESQRAVEPPGGGCAPSQATLSCAQPAPSYANDVVPVLDRDCNTSGCHAVGGTAWPLVNYADVSAWSISIRDDVETCAMPPADAGALPAADKQVLLDWIACGLPND